MTESKQDTAEEATERKPGRERSAEESITFISENGYKLVEENFCVGNASIRLIDILKEVLDES